MATSRHPSRLAATTPSPPFSSSFSNSSSTNQEYLSGAYTHYIRSLVKKHLMSSSSSPARSLHEDHHLNTMVNTTIPHDHHHRPQLQQEQPPVAMQPPAKKQARRRTHASRPYQERLLNMSEARREIVTALKIHRANMRHQQPRTYQHQADTLPPLRQPPLQQLRQQEQQRREQEVQVVFQDRSQAVEEGDLLAAPVSYASYSDHQLYCNPLAHWSSAAAPAGSCYSSPVLPYDLTPPLEVPMPTAMGGLEQLARSLPAQPLGLNLSFVQGFGGSVDGARDCTEGIFGVPVIQSTSSPAASSYSAYSSPATEMASGTYGSPAKLSSTAEKHSSSVDAPATLIVGPVLDDGDTQSAGGEAQGVEWWGDDATAADVVAASAWWSKALLESMESGGGEVAEGGAVGCTPEDVVAAGLPPAEWRWLCDDDGVGEQGAVTGTDDGKPPAFIEMLADGDFYACCYDDGIAAAATAAMASPCRAWMASATSKDRTWSGSHESRRS